MSNKMFLINTYLVFEVQLPEMKNRVVANLEAAAAKTLVKAEHYGDLCSVSFDPVFASVYRTLFGQYLSQCAEYDKVANMNYDDFARWYDAELKRIDARANARRIA